MASEFQIAVMSTSPREAHIAIYVNPSTLVQRNFTIYSDMYPVAWRVFGCPKFGPGSGTPTVLKAEYKQALSAFVAGSSDQNTVTGASFKDVTSDNQTFTVTQEHDIPEIDYAKFVTRASVAISNKTSSMQSFGVGDEKHNAYISVNAPKDSVAEFVNQFEFAVCVVEDIKQGDVFKADVMMPWVSFKADQVTARTVNILYDGTQLSITGAVSTPHDSTVQMFRAS